LSADKIRAKTLSACGVFSLAVRKNIVCGFRFNAFQTVLDLLKEL